MAQNGVLTNIYIPHNSSNIMEDRLEILEEIGLSKNEAKIYLTLLDLGSATASKIADTSKMHRTTVYDALDRLVQKGIVSHIPIFNINLRSPFSPSHHAFAIVNHISPDLYFTKIFEQLFNINLKLCSFFCCIHGSKASILCSLNSISLND